MIPILYAPTETSFTSQGLGGLADTIECIVHEQRNGCFDMTMVMPTNGQHFSDIQKGSFIKAMAAPVDARGAQLFEVVNIQRSMDGMTAEVYCQHIGYRLNRIPVMPYTANTAWDAMQGLSTYAAETNPFTFYTDVTRAGTFTHKTPSSAKACMQGEAGSILQVYQGEYEFNNYSISLLANRGIYRGVSIRYGKNLIDLSMEESIEGVVTGILPYWYGKDGEDDTLVTLPEVIVYSSHASDFPNARTECIDFSGDFEQKPTVAQLRTAANDYITNNNIGVPKVDWDVEFAALAQTTEYATIGLLERINLCDIVTVVFEDFGVNTEAKVVESYYDVLKERYSKIHLGDQRFTLAQTIASTETQIQESEAKTTTIFQQALDQMTALLNGDLNGASMTTQTDANGNPIGLIFMDTNDPATAVNCIQINANGIGFSNNGPGGPYTSAWGINNELDMSRINVIHINASAIDAGTISADYISGGTISASEINIGNGVFTVNSAGKVEASNFNMSGGSIDITTSNQYDAKIKLDYLGWYSEMSPRSFEVEYGNNRGELTGAGVYVYDKYGGSEYTGAEMSSTGIVLRSRNNLPYFIVGGYYGDGTLRLSDNSNSWVELDCSGSSPIVTIYYQSSMRVHLDMSNGLQFWSGGTPNTLVKQYGPNGIYPP